MQTASEAQADKAIPAVQVEGISKHYGAVAALNPTSFSVPSGSYFVLLGPSGGGKTTTLRLIGGLVKPTTGRVLINGVDVTGLAANHRDTTMVFQSYALFPHMSVAENVAYGLTLKKLPSQSISEQVDEILEKTGLAGYQSRMPHELSGGQQQRVQLARSLVLKSSVLLLDEPLAALDAGLRKSMCIELKRLQESFGITFIHVTHNQEEAMTIADEIALIGGGELVESGSVRQIYESPRRRFTAEFFGESTIIDGEAVAVTDAKLAVDCGVTAFELARGADEAQAISAGQSISISMRAECVKLVDSMTPRSDENIYFEGVYDGGNYFGFYMHHRVALANGVVVSVRSTEQTSGSPIQPGTKVTLSIEKANVCVHTD